MSTEEKPLPDFSGGTPAGLPVRPAKAKGIPRGPVKAPTSAFSIIESDETSRTLDFGMSEEDMLDDSDGEGSSSELHDSLRALHGEPGAVTDDFSSLSSDYSSGVREEDTYRKSEPDFELPALDAPSTLDAPAALPTRRSLKNQSLPDFSKFDEVEEVAKPVATKEDKPAAKKISPKLILIFVAAVIVAVIAFVVVAFVIPGSSTPGVIMAPGALESTTQLLQ